MLLFGIVVEETVEIGEQLLQDQKLERELEACFGTVMEHSRSSVNSSKSSRFRFE